MEEEDMEHDTNMERDALVSSSPSTDHSSHGNPVPHQASQRKKIGPVRWPKGGWTQKEDKILEIAVRKFNAKNWKKIAEYLPDKEAVQCLHRWQKVLNPDLVKGAWTKEEDDLIVESVHKLGNKKWREIAKLLPGRIGKQCRERWHNHLNSNINRTPWTKEEELTLKQLHETYGNRWVEIAKILHGRTENSIKNHWNSQMKKNQSSHRRMNLGSIHSIPDLNLEAPNGIVSEIQREQCIDLNLPNGIVNDGGEIQREQCIETTSNIQLSHHKGISDIQNTCPVFLLRSRAMNFKNLPSIIRKRKRENRENEK